MADIAIITAIYDDYDTLKPALPQDGAKVEWVYVTDSYDVLRAGFRAHKDYTLHYEPKKGMHPNRAAKFPKMRPWDYTDAPRSIWIDASFRVTSPRFALDMLSVLEFHEIAQFEHPWRDCIYDEAAETLNLPKYADVSDQVSKQIDRYRDVFGHPRNWGLWATGVIAKNHTDDVQKFGEIWLNENLGFSYQDQLSEAPSLRMCNLRPVPLAGTHFSNPWLSYEASGRHA